MSTETAQNALDASVVATTIASVMLSLPTIVLVLTGLYTIMRLIIEWPKFVCTIKRWWTK